MTTKPTEPGAPSGDARSTTHAPPPLEEGINLASSPSFDQHASDATDRQNLADTLTVGLPHEGRIVPPRPDGDAAGADDDGDAPISGGWFVTNPPPEARAAGAAANAPDADGGEVPAPTAARTDPAMLLLGGIAVAVVVILGGYALFATASP